MRDPVSRLLEYNKNICATGHLHLFRYSIVMKCKEKSLQWISLTYWQLRSRTIHHFNPPTHNDAKATMISFSLVSLSHVYWTVMRVCYACEEYYEHRLTPQ
jgi:hypothetical protein